MSTEPSLPSPSGNNRPDVDQAKIEFIEALWEIHDAGLRVFFSPHEVDQDSLLETITFGGEIRAELLTPALADAVRAASEAWKSYNRGIKPRMKAARTIIDALKRIECVLRERKRLREGFSDSWGALLDSIEGKTARRLRKWFLAFSFVPTGLDILAAGSALFQSGRYNHDLPPLVTAMRRAETALQVLEGQAICHVNRHRVTMGEETIAFQLSVHFYTEDEASSIRTFVKVYEQWLADGVASRGLINAAECLMSDLHSIHQDDLDRARRAVDELHVSVLGYRVAGHLRSRISPRVLGSIHRETGQLLDIVFQSGTGGG